eukprot:CAMPEP_0201489066 /NCGR_PEP_ID=MMETSP0151_2-20130828/21000_1 /ASSEMBLY_ACC=CAM_ASM_000257 /TAXON_ID=200890 /ORGANISM="Paramoeba atlantica, Strain 621/1 / CCAP 1560/9" /LENGTH=555 /DNA_ID=CAMNT_0047874535 /DNA_START=108 /DNA_END=1773 /DNA_ORIENTATION=-
MKNLKIKAEEEGCAHLTVFGGDAFSPSVLSTVLHGKQMVPILNGAGTDVACLGNHDLDFGTLIFKKLKSNCKFTWLCANVTEKKEGEMDLSQSVLSTMEEPGCPLAGCLDHILFTTSNSLKVLFVGLVEEEWMETLSTVSKDSVDFVDSWDWAKENLPSLQEKYQPDITVAVTHQRMPQDYRLAEECGDLIDLILGGHDHHYEDTVKNGIHILNSATEFRFISEIEIEIDEKKAKKTTVKKTRVKEEDPKDLGIVESLRVFQEDVEKKMSKTIGRFSCSLDARFNQIRTKETNISNMLADVMRDTMKADVAILNSGSLRADCIIEEGPFTMKDFRRLLPMEDATIVLRVSGEQLLECLENGFSKYPATEGRFPCLSGVRITFDPEKEPGSRIRDAIIGKQELCKDGKLLLSDSRFSLVTKEYLSNGKDGFDVMTQAEVLVCAENCPTLPNMVRNMFTELKVLGALHHLANKRHESVTEKAIKNFKNLLQKTWKKKEKEKKKKKKKKKRNQNFRISEKLDLFLFNQQLMMKKDFFLMAFLQLLMVVLFLFFEIDFF